MFSLVQALCTGLDFKGKKETKQGTCTAVDTNYNLTSLPLIYFFVLCLILVDHKVLWDRGSSLLQLFVVKGLWILSL